MIELTGKLEAKDYVRAQYLHIRPRPVFKIVGTLLLLLLGWAIWYSYWGGGSGDLTAYDLMLPGAVVYLVSNYYVYIPWKARRIFAQQKSFHRDAQSKFDDAGLAASSEVGEVTIPWSDYLKWKENGHMFLLYFSEPSFQMIPKRHFATSGDIKGFRRLLESKIGRSAV